MNWGNARNLNTDTGYACDFQHDILQIGETKKAVSVNLNISLWHSGNKEERNLLKIFIGKSSEPLHDTYWLYRRYT